MRPSNRWLASRRGLEPVLDELQQAITAVENTVDSDYMEKAKAFVFDHLGPPTAEKAKFSVPDDIAIFWDAQAENTKVESS